MQLIRRLFGMLQDDNKFVTIDSLVDLSVNRRPKLSTNRRPILSTLQRD